MAFPGKRTLMLVYQSDFKATALSNLTAFFTSSK